MSEAEAEAEVRALVAGHGDFAAGLVSAVGQITGRGEAFLTLSNRDMSAADVERAMREQVEGRVEVIFTDLPAGSCTMAARRLQRERPSVVIVTGTNLATLLDFVFHTDVPAAEAARHAADKGRAALVVTGGSTGGH
jgi:PTS system N-acetylgalactosamine-specific IIA component